MKKLINIRLIEYYSAEMYANARIEELIKSAIHDTSLEFCNRIDCEECANTLRIGGEQSTRCPVTLINELLKENYYSSEILDPSEGCPPKSKGASCGKCPHHAPALGNYSEGCVLTELYKIIQRFNVPMTESDFKKCETGLVNLLLKIHS